MVRLKGKFMTTIIIDLRKLTNKMKTKKRLTTYRYFLLLMWTGWVKQTMIRNKNLSRQRPTLNILLIEKRELKSVIKWVTWRLRVKFKSRVTHVREKSRTFESYIDLILTFVLGQDCPRKIAMSTTVSIMFSIVSVFKFQKRAMLILDPLLSFFTYSLTVSDIRWLKSYLLIVCWSLTHPYYT